MKNFTILLVLILWSLFTNAAPRLDIWFYKKDASNSFVYTDATAAYFDNAFHRAYNVAEDISKAGNFGENISLYRDNNWISIERTVIPTDIDTLFLQQWKLATATYKFEIHADNMSAINQAYIIDNYLGTITALNMTGITDIIYDVDLSIAASMNLNRFQIVFKSAATLPVNFTNIKAYKKDNGVTIEWDVNNETGIANYEIERSADGINFTKFTGLAATNVATAHTYKAFDASPVNGTNYYRVKSTGLNAAVKYTSVVKINIGKDGNAAISIYPNPVKNNTVNISLSNIVKGKYSLIVYSNNGKQVAIKNININNSGTINETISLPYSIAKGIYHLSVKGASSLTKQLIIE